MAQVSSHKVKTDWGVFTLHTAEKVARVIEGTTNAKGEFMTGLGRDASGNDVLVAYDRLAGYITGKEGAKVKTGCFYNVREKAAHGKPEVIYTFRVGGKNVDVPAGKELPLKVKAVQEEKKEAKKEAKKKKKSKK